MMSHRSSAQEAEIERFRRWYIDNRTGAPPPGFRWKWRVDYNAVNDAVSQFIRDGFRYPGYPYSNF